MKKTPWLDNFEKELNKALERTVVSSEAGSLFLDTALSTAQKLEKHSRKCSRCEELKPIFLEYILDLQSLEPEAFFRQANGYKLKTLKKKKCDVVHEHLKEVHHYKGIMDNRITFIALGIVVGVILFVVNLYIDFGWHLLFSFITVALGWFIGYSLDKRNKKKGWVI